MDYNETYIQCAFSQVLKSLQSGAPMKEAFKELQISPNGLKSRLTDSQNQTLKEVSVRILCRKVEFFGKTLGVTEICRAIGYSEERTKWVITRLDKGVLFREIVKTSPHRGGRRRTLTDAEKQTLLTQMKAGMSVIEMVDKTSIPLRTINREWNDIVKLWRTDTPVNELDSRTIVWPSLTLYPHEGLCKLEKDLFINKVFLDLPYHK